MVGRLDADFLFCLDIIHYDAKLFLDVYGDILFLLVVVRGIIKVVVKNVLEFESLQLVELCAWQVAIVDEDVHYLLVILDSLVVGLNDECL